MLERRVSFDMDVKNISRRSLASMALAAIGNLLYRVAAHNRWIIVTRAARRFSRGLRPSNRAAQRGINLFVVGDTGLPTERRDSVVAMMGRATKWCRPKAVVMHGDNFYESGVRSVADPNFESKFENTFDRQLFDFPFHPTLGNHDYFGDVSAQVQYSQHSDRWRMPATYYTIHHRNRFSSLDLFVIDTNPIDSGSLPASE
jgi:hypothetical protein